MSPPIRVTIFARAAWRPLQRSSRPFLEVIQRLFEGQCALIFFDLLLSGTREDRIAALTRSFFQSVGNLSVLQA